MTRRSMEELRKRIDETDKVLLQTLAERFALVKELGKIKKELDLPAENTARENEVLQQRGEHFQSLGYEDSEFIEQLFTLLFKKSKMLQQ